MQLAEGSFGKVDIQDVGQANQVGEDVGQLFGHTGMKWISVSEVKGLAGREPLEEFGDLADLADKGEDQGLRIVELAPVAFLCEGSHAVAQLNQIRHAASMTRILLVALAG
jgi:hypothetical protein